MRARLIVALIALGGLTCLVGFAPAPFPRPVRRADNNEITIRTFQGDWKALAMYTVDRNRKPNKIGLWFQGVRVKGDRWIYMVNNQENLSYRLVIEGTKKPPTIDYYEIQGQPARPGMVGILRREANRITVLYYATGPESRAKTFDDMPPNWWVLELERQ
jgi:uncharacterized protein (TIGR03067 family)